MRPRRYLRVIAIASSLFVSFTVAASGCGSEQEDGTPSSSGTSGTSGASSGTSSTSGGTSGTSGGLLDGSNIPDVDFSYDAPLRPETDACAQTSAVASVKPLDMFIMLDRSGSMYEPQASSAKGDCDIGQSVDSRWCRAINALSSYLKSPSATGHAAALQYFLNTSLNCDGTTYNQSYVPGGATGYVDLPSSAFDTPLNALVPQGATPTEGALRGIAGFTGRAANQRAGRITIGVIITDAEPGACDFSINNLSTILQNHYTATGIQTFVVGMTGANFTSLETIATGGNAPLHADAVGTVTDACGNGAGPCRHWSVGDGNGNALTEALKQIQGAAIACQYTMPKPQSGVVNPNNVNVEYLQNGVPPAKKLMRVTNAASCVANGWYYDNNTTPTTIQLCTSQCSAIQGDANAKINVQLGCLGG